MPWGLLIIVLVIIGVYLVAGVLRWFRQWLQPEPPENRGARRKR
jgi:hypothetical protein